MRPQIMLHLFSSLDGRLTAPPNRNASEWMASEAMGESIRSGRQLYCVLEIGMNGEDAMKYFFGIVPPLSIYEKLMSVRNQYHYSGVEPHITVKLSYGTGAMLPVNWMSECKRIIEGFRSFSVTVGELRYFGDKDVLYIGAHSPELTELHRKLVAVFEPTEEQMKHFFELDLYIPHITVAKKSSLLEEILEEMERTLSPHFQDSQTFDVHEIRLYARDDQHKTFQKYEDIQMTR